jgi:hypothetical protein
MGCGSEHVAITLPNDFRMGYRLDSHSLLRKTVEKFSAASRISTIETEGKFIEIVVKVLMANGPLVGAQQPSFEERNYSMDPWEKFAWRLFVAAEKTHFVDIAVRFDRKIPSPGIGMHYATGLDGFSDEGNKAVGGSVRKLFHSDPSYTPAIFLSRNYYQRFVGLLAAAAAFLYATNVSFVDLDPTRKPFSPWSDHRATKLMKPHPCRLVASQAQNLLQSKCARSRFLARYVPHGAKPKRKGLTAILKDRTRSHRCLVATLRAVKQDSSRPPCLVISATGAVEPLWPSQPKQVLPTGFFAREPRLQLRQCPREIFHDQIYYLLGLLESST